MTGKTCLWRTFGVLWLVDGVLQLQPAMFTSAFVQNVLQPLLQGQPAWLASLLRVGIAGWNWNPVLADSLSAAIQIFIGMLLLVWPERRGGRLGLWLAVGWSLVVWVCGEGLGMLLAPPFSLVTGAPGSVLLYLVAAVALLTGASRLLPWFLSIFYGLFAVAQLITPSFWTAQGLTALYAGYSTPQPKFLAEAIRAAAHLAGSHPGAMNVILVLLMVGSAWAWLAVARGGRPSGAVFAGMALFVLFMWVCGQDLGILGGTGTDPNTAIPLLALSWAGWYRDRDMSALRFGLAWSRFSRSN